MWNIREKDSRLPWNIRIDLGKGEERTQQGIVIIENVCLSPHGPDKVSTFNADSGNKFDLF